MRDRMTHLGLGQHRVLYIEFKKGRIVEKGVIAGVQLERGLLQQASEIGQTQVLGDIGLACFHGRRDRRGIADKAEDHAIHMGHALAPVVRIALEDHMAAAHPLLEHKGTGAHGGRDVGACQRICIAVAPGRNDGQLCRRQRLQQKRRRFGEH